MNATEKEQLLSKINAYVVKRQGEFCGGLFGTYDKSDKIVAAQALMGYINKPDDIGTLSDHLGPLNNKRLGQLWKEFLRLNPDLHEEIASLQNKQKLNPR